jgi:hypothetical protein
MLPLRKAGLPMNTNGAANDRFVTIHTFLRPRWFRQWETIMRNLLVSFVILFFCLTSNAQVSTNTGSIYGKVLDEQTLALPGVSVQLESDVVPVQSATTGSSGAFRFSNLPPGMYAARFKLTGFTELLQEGIRVTVGANIELEITLRVAPAEELTVVGETPLLNTKKSGHETTYSREYLDEIPGGRDPWFIIEQTPGIDSDRYNVAGSESGNQSQFFARGGNDQRIWNYDGVNASDHGDIPAYPDFDSFEEIQIVTGGNDASIQTGAVVINLVTKRGGNKWEGNASYYVVDDSFQSNNTPQELIENPIINPLTGEPARGSNRIKNIQEYGFDVGGPVLKDRFFAWSAFRRNQIEQFSIQDVPDNTTLTNLNLKTNVSWSSAHETQVAYSLSDKTKIGREFFPGEQAPEALWDQKGYLGTISFPGFLNAQHTWIPNDHTMLTAHYADLGYDWGLIPRGGKNVPIIYLASIPHWEDTFYYVSPVQYLGEDASTDVNHFKEDWIGGDHEFKFGFSYSHTRVNQFSSYGNGVLLGDYYQTQPGGPLTTGYLVAQHYVDARYIENRLGFYVSDTYRKDRLTLNLGLRFDHQTGRNGASSIPGVPGFEQFVGAFNYPGGDPGIAFNDFSPRAGATFDLTGDGKTLLRGNFARYYNAFDSGLAYYSNPTAVYNGVIFGYVNRNGDRTITPDELVGDPYYYGGLNGPNFDLDAFLAKRKYADDLTNVWTNEFILGIEREALKDLAVSVTYTYRRYGNFWAAVPYGVTAADYVPGGIFHAETSLGTFDVPYFVLPEDFQQDGTGIAQNVPDYTQTYQGLDITARRRIQNNLLLNGSLTIQRQKAHYNSAAALAKQPFITFPGSTFAFDPTNFPFLNDQTYAFSGRQGIRPFSEWYFKVSGYYQLPHDFGIGAFLRYQQGYPYVISAAVSDSSLSAFYGTSTHQFFVEPFGKRRLDNKFTLDLRVEKSLAFRGSSRITGAVDIFNVTNSNVVLRRNGVIGKSNLNQIAEVLSPRAFRFGIRYSY